MRHLKAVLLALASSPRSTISFSLLCTADTVVSLSALLVSLQSVDFALLKSVFNNNNKHNHNGTSNAGDIWRKSRFSTNISLYLGNDAR